MVAGLDAFRGHLVLSERQDALPRLSVRDLATGETHRIEVPEAIERSSWPSRRRGEEGGWVRVLQQLRPSDGHLMAGGRFGQATDAAGLADRAD